MPRSFVNPGEPLDFVSELVEKKLWPPPKREFGDGDKPVITPFLVVPASFSPVDDGTRPLPNSIAFHSQSIWIEDRHGVITTTPQIDIPYQIKCRIKNLGALPSYGGLVDFFVNRPEVFNNAAGSNVSLPSIGHTGFTLLVDEETEISCPNLWIPATDEDLKSTLLVHVYDLFADKIISRFDARNDRHVGRHDFVSDLYVRDWTDSAAIHDLGAEPSTRACFFMTSDIWNRRSSSSGTFVNDQPDHQKPQQGEGAAGNNFMFARISRNEAAFEQTVKAHFLFAEFGTGSPYIDCSTADDPEITLAAGETSGIVSLPWHLHPSSSNHLCIAVQIYSDSDPYLPPGLLGYTPGWPTTDLMFINDNNKAQRNTSVWEGIPDTEGEYFGIAFNAATFKRDMVLVMDASMKDIRKLQNARVNIVNSDTKQPFLPGREIILKNMMPGERRWISIAYDGIHFSGSKDQVSLYFNEVVDEKVINGFGFTFVPTTADKLAESVITLQNSVMYRMSVGMKIGTAGKVYKRSKKVEKTIKNLQTYQTNLPVLTQELPESIKELGKSYGIKDVFDTTKNIKTIETLTAQNQAAGLALHNKILHQLDALQTMAKKNQGDTADILYTVRLQRDIFRTGRFLSAKLSRNLLITTENFIHNYTKSKNIEKEYAALLRLLISSIKNTVHILDKRSVNMRYKKLEASLNTSPEKMQKAHLEFLNTLPKNSPKR